MMKNDTTPPQKITSFKKSNQKESDQNTMRKQKTKSDNKQQAVIRVSELRKYDRILYRKKAFELFEKGYGYCVTARILKLSLYTVRDWYCLYKEGYFEPEMKKPGNCSSNILPEEIKEKVRGQYKEGDSISNLSKKYGKSKSTIRYWLKDITLQK